MLSAATKRLLNKEVTQIIRNREVVTGVAEVFANRRSLGMVLITDVELVKFTDLDEEDARRCGFDSVERLLAFLKRRDHGLYTLEGCSGWRIRFTWDVPKEMLLGRDR